MCCYLTTNNFLTYGVDDIGDGPHLHPQFVPLAAAVVKDAAVVEGTGVLHFGVGDPGKASYTFTDGARKRDRKNKQITAGAKLRIFLIALVRFV